MKIYFKYFLMIYVVLVLKCEYRVVGEPQVPCLFIFGDSLSDNGNNNNLVTLAKVNYKPYGLDFPKGPTGRFTNGRNLPDFIAENLGFNNPIPPFAMIKHSKGYEILQGVNYASGAAGILNETSKHVGQVISLDKQLKNHNYTISKVQSLMGNNNNATTHLKRCLYMVEMGANDYLNNYFSPFSTTMIQFSPRVFARALIQKFSSQFQTLYNQGARKFAVYGVGLLGCTPYARANFDTQGSPCVDKINNAVQLFNSALKSLVQDLNANFTDAYVTFIDLFSISSSSISLQGDEIISDAPCCDVAPGQILCIPFGKVCANRTKYTFWDEVHPTEASFMVLANRSFNAQLPTDTYPYDISHLAQL